MLKVFLFSAVSTLVVLSSCGPQNGSIEDKNAFTISSFIDGEINKMNSDSVLWLRKTCVFNGQLADSLISGGNWQRELAVFRLIDIDLPSNRDSYEIDTIDDPRGNVVVRYNAKNPRPFTRSAEIIRNGEGKVIMLRAGLMRKTTLNRIELMLAYLPGSGFHILQHSEDRITGKRVEMELNASIYGRARSLW